MVSTAPLLLLLLLRLLLLLGLATAPPSQQDTNRTVASQTTARRLQARRVGAYEPVQIHLGYTGEDAGSVVVQWVTAAMASLSFVEWGPDVTSRWRSAANSTQCGPEYPVYPGWTGVLHQARMDGVASRRTYYYRVGSDDGMSAQRGFRVPGYAESAATMLVAADVGTSTNAVLLWAQLRREVATADVLMLAGGTANAGVSPQDHGSQGTWDNFFEQAEEVLTYLPVSVAAGSQDAYSDPPFRPFNLRFPRLSARRMSADGSTSGSMAGFPNWYAYYMGPMRVVVVSTEHCATSPGCAVQDAVAENEQLVWLDAELGYADARRTRHQPWVVLVGHRPLYSSSQDHSPGDAQLRARMEPLIVRHGVDLALWGNTRQYERTWPVAAERVLFGGASTSVTGADGNDEALSLVPSGPVHVNVGPGGEPRHRGWEPNPWTAKTANPQWSPGGYVKVTADSACGLHVQYTGLHGEIQDEFGLFIGAVEPIEMDIEVIPWGERAWDVWDRFEDPGQNWNKLDSSNSLVSVGWQVFRPAPLGFRELGLATTLEDDAVAYFFRKVVSLSHVECLDDFKISFQRDDGAVIYVNGDEIGRSNMPAGPVNFITEASSGLNNAAETEVVSLTVNASHNPFKAGLNVIGVSVHQFTARKRHPCTPQGIVYECRVAQALSAIAPEPEPLPPPPPPPPVPLPAEPISSDVLISSITLGLCGAGALGYVSYQIHQCTQKKVEVTKKQKRVKEVKVMSTQKEAALLASKMTDARNLSQAGKNLVIAGKAKGAGIQMSYAHKENMAVKAGNVFEAVSNEGKDAWSELPRERSVQIYGGASVHNAYNPGAPVASRMIPTMTKKDLVVELRQRGLPVSGSTPQLQARLLKCVEAEEKKAAAKAAKKAAKAQEKAKAKAQAKAEKLEQKQRGREESSKQSSTGKAP